MGQFLRGMFNLKRYQTSLILILIDGNVLNVFLQKAFAHRLLGVHQVCALITGHRCQNFHAMVIHDIESNNIEVIFYIGQNVKQENPEMR